MMIRIKIIEGKDRRGNTEYVAALYCGKGKSFGYREVLAKSQNKRNLVSKIEKQLEEALKVFRIDKTP